MGWAFVFRLLLCLTQSTQSFSPSQLKGQMTRCRISVRNESNDRYQIICHKCTSAEQQQHISLIRIWLTNSDKFLISRPSDQSNGLNVPQRLLTFFSHLNLSHLTITNMKNPVVPSWTESTRNLFKPVIVLVITFAATVKLSQSLYRYNLRRRSRARSGAMSSSSSSDNGTGVQARRRSRILSSKLYFDIPNSKVNLYINFICVLNFFGFGFWVFYQSIRCRWFTRLHTILLFLALRSCKRWICSSFIFTFFFKICSNF